MKYFALIMYFMNVKIILLNNAHHEPESTEDAYTHAPMRVITHSHTVTLHPSSSLPLLAA